MIDGRYIDRWYAYMYVYIYIDRERGELDFFIIFYVF